MDPTSIEDGFKIAVLIPCRNQAATIGGIVRGFVAALPGAKIYVFDNNSTDDTARIATREGARVYREARAGKGSVVRRMFADIEADIYVLADGDGRYDPADAPSLVNALITERVDMVVGTRSVAGNGPRHSGRSFGDRAFDWAYRRCFAGPSTDIVSGYRALTRRFVKSFPAISTGFDVEVELSMHASQLMIPVAEIALNDGYAPRSSSGKDGGIAAGLRALGMLAILCKETRPFLFFAAFAVVFWAVGLLLTSRIVVTEVQGDLVASFSDAFLGLGFFVAGFIIAGCGLVLEALGRSRVEQKRVLFLTVPGLGAQ
jgi:glycosyltransferase involved in cell wall biosynthesis